MEDKMMEDIQECLFEKYPFLLDLERDPVKFHDLPSEVRELLARALNPSSQWRLVAEEMGITAKQCDDIATWTKYSGNNCLNMFDVYQSKVNSLKIFCQALVKRGREDALLVIQDSWNKIIAQHEQNEAKPVPVEHPNSPHISLYGYNCGCPSSQHHPSVRPKTYNNCVMPHVTAPANHHPIGDSMEKARTFTATHNTIPKDPNMVAAGGFLTLVDPRSQMSTEANIAEDTQYSMEKHIQTARWVKQHTDSAPVNPKSSKVSPKSGKRPAILQNIADVFRIDRKVNKKSVPESPSPHPKSEVMTSDTSLEMSSLTDSQANPSLYLQKGLPLNPPKTEHLPSFNQTFLPSQPSPHLIHGQERPMLPVENTQRSWPSYPAGDHTPQAQGHQPSPRAMLPPRMSPVNPMRPPTHHMTNPFQSPGPGQRSPYNPEVPGAVEYKYNPYRPVPFANVCEPRDAREPEPMDTRQSSVNSLRGAEGGQLSNTADDWSQPSFGQVALSLRGPDADKFQTVPLSKQDEIKLQKDSGGKSLDDAKRSLSTQGRMETKPFTDNLRNVSIFVTHLFAHWEQSDQQSRYNKCAVSLGKCLKENKFRIQMDIPKREHIPHKEVSWRDWIDRKFLSANYILVCLHPAYLDVVNATHIVDTDDIDDNVLSTRYIYHLMEHEFEEKKMTNKRFIPVLFSPVPTQNMPSFLQRVKSYRWTQDFLDLFWRLTQPDREVDKILANQQG